jgi:acetyl-CoA carboxylase carboxyl transferase subunit alpha
MKKAVDGPTIPHPMKLITLEFEKPIADLERKLAELKTSSAQQRVDLGDEIRAMEQKVEETKRAIYSNLTAWQRVQLARHPNRPYLLDYVKAIFQDFLELHGDRRFADDRAIVGGFARIDGEQVMLIGHQKGRNTKENLLRNFGCAHPEGYRKALRLMQLADKFGVPIVTLIDTPGAYPGVGAEERHIAEAIAVNLREMTVLRVPIIAIVIGEGGSGGALGIGVGDRILMHEFAIYSVIPPEGCAAILWRDAARKVEAAEALKLTAPDLLHFGVVDAIVKEPIGGAHADPAEAARLLDESLDPALEETSRLGVDARLERRYQKLRRMGTATRGGRRSENRELTTSGEPGSKKQGRRTARRTERRPGPGIDRADVLPTPCVLHCSGSRIRVTRHTRAFCRRSWACRP